MTGRRIIARSLLGLAAGLALTVTAAPPTAAAASAPPATWKLIDLDQRFCTPTDLGRIIYFPVFIEGAWSQEVPVNLGIGDDWLDCNNGPRA